MRQRRTLTFNPDDRHEWVRLSENRLEVSYDNADGEAHQMQRNGMVRSTIAWTGGTHYFEFTLNRTDDSDDWEIGSGYPSVGVVAPDVPLGGTDEYVIGGSHGRGWGYYLGTSNTPDIKIHGGLQRNVAEGERTIDDFRHDVRYGILLDMEQQTLDMVSSPIVLFHSQNHCALPSHSRQFSLSFSTWMANDSRGTGTRV